MMLQFEKSSARWWQKPLVVIDGRHLPAELAVLGGELKLGETGAWLNSRGVKSATVDVVCDQSGRFKTVRAALPRFVAAHLEELYREARVTKGAPDLVVWHEPTHRIRFIEVKNPHCDRMSSEQLQFFGAAEALGISIAIVEWEFRP
jgi:hypothetical protein